MRNVWKITLLIWDILLIPVILLVVSCFLEFGDTLFSAIAGLPGFLSVPLDGLVLTALCISYFSKYLIPQIISVVLVIVNNTMPLYPPSKKERVFTDVLSVLAVLGAVCAILAILFLSSGENGVRYD